MDKSRNAMALVAQSIAKQARRQVDTAQIMSMSCKFSKQGIIMIN